MGAYRLQALDLADLVVDEKERLQIHELLQTFDLCDAVEREVQRAEVHQRA